MDIMSAAAEIAMQTNNKNGNQEFRSRHSTFIRYLDECSGLVIYVGIIVNLELRKKAFHA